MPRLPRLKSATAVTVVAAAAVTTVVVTIVAASAAAAVVIAAAVTATAANVRGKARPTLKSVGLFCEEEESDREGVSWPQGSGRRLRRLRERCIPRAGSSFVWADEALRP